MIDLLVMLLVLYSDGLHKRTSLRFWTEVLYFPLSQPSILFAKKQLFLYPSSIQFLLHCKKWQVLGAHTLLKSRQIA